MPYPLRQTILHAGLSEADLRLLGSFEHQATVVHRGGEICSSPGTLHVLVEGCALKYRMLVNGARQITGVHLDGEVCDLDRLFFPRLAFGVQAASTCRVARLRMDLLKRAATENPDVYGLLWSLTVLENIAVTELVTSLGSRTARERMAWFLCEFEARLKARGRSDDGAFHLDLTQGDIADLLGLSVVHTNRTLQDLRMSGMISSRGSNYMILDVAALRSFAGYEADVLRRANGDEGRSDTP